MGFILPSTTELTGIGVIDGEAYGGTADSRACREDAPFVVAQVVAMQNDTPGSTHEAILALRGQTTHYHLRHGHFYR